MNHLKAASLRYAWQFFAPALSGSTRGGAAFASVQSLSSYGVTKLAADHFSAFIGVAVGQWISRKGATELDVWRRREETMRMLRWASEQAASSDEARALMGVAALEALRPSELMQEADRELVVAVIASLVQAPLEALEDSADAVVQRVSIDSPGAEGET